MATVEEVIRLARRLPPEQQQEVARALASRGQSRELPLAAVPSAPPPHSAAWVKAEQGHAVLATRSAPSEAHVPRGPEALVGIWADHRGLPDRLEHGQE